MCSEWLVPSEHIQLYRRKLSKLYGDCHTKLLLDLAARFPPYNNKLGKDNAMGSAAATAAIVCLGCLQPKEIVRADLWTQKEDRVFEEQS